ncbi:MAG: hypothetical protein KKD17_06860 [Nanoarchaeota archaeon]|nr:hypothetical protein [Nanoarchaeota archaeon]
MLELILEGITSIARSSMAKIAEARAVSHAHKLREQHRLEEAIRAYIGIADSNQDSDQKARYLFEAATIAILSEKYWWAQNLARMGLSHNPSSKSLRDALIYTVEYYQRIQEEIPSNVVHLTRVKGQEKNPPLSRTYGNTS